MRGPMAVSSVLLLVFGLSLLCPELCEAQNIRLRLLSPRVRFAVMCLGLDNILLALGQQLKKLWQNNELEFMGNTCFYSQSPKIRRFKLYFDGNFTCPGWTNITGEARTRSRSGVMTRTIENFLQQAQTRNLISDEEALIWLEGYTV